MNHRQQAAEIVEDLSEDMCQRYLFFLSNRQSGGRQIVPFFDIFIDRGDLHALLKNRITQIETESTTRALAEWLHRTMCTKNHADACRWYYEEKDCAWSWTQPEHLRWFATAGNLLTENNLQFRKPDND